MLRFRTTDGKSVVWAMPMSLLAGSGEELRAILLDRGAEISLTVKACCRVTCLASIRELELTSTSRVGWHNVGAFVLPDKSYGRDSAGIVFQSGEREHGDYGVRGTLDGWQTAVAALAVGNPTLALGLSAAFVGPLLAKVAPRTAACTWWAKARRARPQSCRQRCRFGAHHSTCEPGTGRRTALKASPSCLTTICCSRRDQSMRRAPYRPDRVFTAQWQRQAARRPERTGAGE